MKTHRLLQRGFTLVELLVVITIIAALVGLTAPMVMKNVKKGPFIEALSNAKQIHIALLAFDTEYSSYPDKETLAAVRQTTESPLAAAATLTHSNDYFRQLLAAGHGNEKMFYAKAAGTRKPDDISNTPAKALEAGEVGFAYIMDKTTAFSSANGPGIPLLATPLVKGSADLFDVGPFGDKAVILLNDGSAQEVRIPASKKLMLNGKPFTVTGDDTVWGTSITPKIVPPKMRGESTSAPTPPVEEP